MHLYEARKLKCDGGRPACSQCLKRSNPCDYMPQNNRRGTLRHRRGEESESDSGDDRSELDEPSVSPEVLSQPLSRRSSNVERLPKDALISSLSERRENPPPLPPPPSQQPRSKIVSSSSPVEPRSLFKDNELPHIATLSLPETSPVTPMSAPTLPPIRPASEQQAAQRKRAATIPGKTTRQTSSSGPKVVACNFCRGSLYINDDKRAVSWFAIQLVRPSVTGHTRPARVVLAGHCRATMSTMPGQPTDQRPKRQLVVLLRLPRPQVLALTHQRHLLSLSIQSRYSQAERTQTMQPVKVSQS